MPSDRTLHQSRKPWYFSLIDRSGRPRFDVSPIFASPKAFQSLLGDISTFFQEASPPISYDKIVGLDALGFILGAGLAVKVEKPFVPLRKGGKLPFQEDRLQVVDFKDYDGDMKRFELLKGMLGQGDRVLLVDEWVGTGAQMRAAIELVERSGAVVAGFVSIYVHPDFPDNIEMVKKYETFTANCLVCKYFECRCEARDGPQEESKTG